jgi:NAD(P)-dependent dehydrogenase (short-subunit alcohol dehydrogenase family)
VDFSLASLEGRVAIVTGAGIGIGRAIAMGLEDFGADVVVVDVDEAAAREVVGAVEAAGRRALLSVTDVEDGAAVREMVARTVEMLGRIDVLVNNVGGSIKQPFLETDEDRWDYLIRHNLKGTLHCTQAVARVMVEQGWGGSIINVSTIEAHRAAPNYAVYSAAKAGVSNFTKTMALELGPYDIRVNELAPDVILTPRIRKAVPPEREAVMARHIPIGRPGQSEDAAGTAIYLASDLSKWITGNTIHVGGGTAAAAGWHLEPGEGWVT